MAAMTAPVSSKALSLSVMAARITASLPFEGDAQEAHPFAPVLRRLVEETPAHFAGGFVHRLVGPQQQRHLVFQEEGRFLEDGGDGGVGGQPQHLVGHRVADVVAAPGDAGPAGAVVASRPQAHHQARAAGKPGRLAHQHGRPEHAPVLAEPGREIGQFDASALAVEQPGHQDRGIFEVVLLDALAIHQFDGEEAAVLGSPSAASRTPDRRRSAGSSPRPCGPGRRPARRPCSCRSMPDQACSCRLRQCAAQPVPHGRHVGQAIAAVGPARTDLDRQAVRPG